MNRSIAHAYVSHAAQSIVLPEGADKQAAADLLNEVRALDMASATALARAFLDGRTNSDSFSHDARSKEASEDE